MRQREGAASRDRLVAAIVLAAAADDSVAVDVECPSIDGIRALVAAMLNRLLAPLAACDVRKLMNPSSEPSVGSVIAPMMSA
jgi:hypothetical protein